MASNKSDVAVENLSEKLKKQLIFKLTEEGKIEDPPTSLNESESDDNPGSSHSKPGASSISLDVFHSEDSPATEKPGAADDVPQVARLDANRKQDIESDSSIDEHDFDDFSLSTLFDEDIDFTSEEEEEQESEDDDTAKETKRLEERRLDGRRKWTTLQHKGPIFPPPYVPLPRNISFYYDGKIVWLNKKAEEAATFYAIILDNECTKCEVFNGNFLKDWKKLMTDEEKELILDLKKCDFKEINSFYKQKVEEAKTMSKDEKLAVKKQKEELKKEFGYCTLDGQRQAIGNFKIEPPGIFRGRGNNPKRGMLKKRIKPENVVINCSADSVFPVPPPGHTWKEVHHNNMVTWLASWSDDITGSTKYIMLSAASELKGKQDLEKYEIARRLHSCIDVIRRNYQEDWKSNDMKIFQRGVALYFIDRLSLRTGNKKREATAETFGCCSLRVEHIKLHEEMDGQKFVVELYFLGKDSICYHNTFGIDICLFKELQLFMEKKRDSSDDLFDKLTPAALNQYLRGFMAGLTVKVFRTYNASRTLEEQLDSLTKTEDCISAKLHSYKCANRSVAMLCNHQRASPKTFVKQMESLHNKDERKDLNLWTSKMNYMDPRITVAWCKRWKIPVKKVYSKVQRERFAWAIKMDDGDYRFCSV